MSDSKEYTRGMYVIGEIQEPDLVKTSHVNYIYFVFTLIGIGLFVSGILSYLYSAGLMIVYGLRAQYWNYGFISLGIAIFFFYSSRYFRNKLGFTTFKNNYQSYEIKPFLGKKIKLEKPQIYALSIQYDDKFFGILKDQPYALISMYDRNVKIPIYRYRNSEEMMKYFSELAVLLQDEYYNIFQKSEMSSHSLIKRVWSQTTGKVSLTIISIFLFFGFWGLFSLLLYPSNTLYANSFFLKNPEISNSFYEGYDSSSIVYVPPNETFLLGTDWFGRDIFARLVYGTVHSFGVGIMSATIFIVLVAIFGYSAAFSRGWWDEFISRIADTLLIFPPIIPIIIIATFGSGINYRFEEQYYYFVFFFVALFTWPQGMKLLRSETKRLLKEEYVAASRLLGADNRHIIFNHVIPKTSGTLVLLFVYTITEVIIGMTMLGLIELGLGSSVTWGSDLERAITFTDIPLQDRWWTLVFPSIWVAVIIIGLTLLSDTIRDQYQLGRNQLQVK